MVFLLRQKRLQGLLSEFPFRENPLQGLRRDFLLRQTSLQDLLSKFPLRETLSQDLRLIFLLRPIPLQDPRWDSVEARDGSFQRWS